MSMKDISSFPGMREAREIKLDLELELYSMLTARSMQMY